MKQSAHIIHLPRGVKRQAERYLAKERLKGNTMKVDFTKAMLDLDGKPMRKRAGPDDCVLVLAQAGIPPARAQEVVGALFTDHDTEEAEYEPITFKFVVPHYLKVPDEEVKRSDGIDRIALALRIRSANVEVEISNAEAKTIRDCCEKATKKAGKLALYRVNELLTLAEAAALPKHEDKG